MYRGITIATTCDFVCTYTLITSGANLEKAQDHISRGFSGENDETLTCSVCNLSFTSSYSKQSHYSGKLHLQTLLQNIDRVIRTESEQKSCKEAAVASSLKKVAADYDCKLSLAMSW